MQEETDDTLPHQPSEEDVTEMMTPPTGGGSILPASAGPLREVIGDFEVQAKLGSGGMGAVYRARQISLGRMVALKILPAHMIEDADAVSRFQREARVAASLSHAHLVRVYSAGEADGCHYIAMELIEGEDLGRRLKRDGRMAAPEALRICADVARGLEHAWQTAHLIHRDIKPANIFLSAQGEVKVGDLGLAKSILGNTTGLTQTGTMMGTPHYISPEQARADKEIDFRADIYSLGCTLYQMLTGTVPYGGTDAITIIRQHLDAPLPAILKAWPQCPVPLARLVGRMLKKSRHERPASYAELLTQIESVWAQIDPVSYNPKAFAPPPPPDPEATLLETPATPRATATLPPSAPPPKSKTPLYAALAAGVVILGIASFLLWPKPEKLTKAQLYAQQRAAEQQAPVTAPVLPPPAAPARPAKDSEPAAIRLWNSPEKVRPEPGKEWADDALKLDQHGANYPGRPSRDAILRATIRTSPDTLAVNLALRYQQRTPAERASSYAVVLRPQKKLLALLVQENGQGRDLETWPLPRIYGADEWVQVELRAVGDALTVSLDGKVLGTVHDRAITGPGGVDLNATASTYFRDIEYIPLDGVAASVPVARQPGTDAAWKDLISVGGWPDSCKVSDGILTCPANTGTSRVFAHSFRDGAVRASFRWTAADEEFQVGLRKVGDQLIRLQMFPGDHPSAALVSFNLATRQTLWREVKPLPGPPKIGELLRFELRAVGSEVTLLLNDQPFLRGTDEAPQSGRTYFFTKSSAPPVIERFDVLNLDGLAATPPAEPWQDVLANPPKFSTSGEVQRTADGLLFTGPGSAMRHSTLSPRQDGAVRLKTTWGGLRPAVMVRNSLKSGVDGMYQLIIRKTGAAAAISRIDNATAQNTTLKEFNLSQPLKEGAPYELELRVVDQTFTAKLNGEVLGSAEDGFYHTGNFGMGVYDKEGAPTLVKSLEVLDLDASAGASAPPAPSPAAATKDAPFVNGLGMKFVPVPITGGPTGGQRVLFSVWETRVQDYGLFAAETKREWPKVTPLEPKHPAVNVSWEDAQAFCAWLAERDRKAGKIGPGERYRLPSDHEWSCAVGIGEREDAALPPSEKNNKIDHVYPWGEMWPPPAGAGNFRGEENSGDAKDLVVPGYRDPFPGPAPVGSFAANERGLFDLGGNVWEWVEDQFASIQATRVVRGGSAWNGVRGILLSSARPAQPASLRAGNLGFRVVLAPVP